MKGTFVEVDGERVYVLRPDDPHLTVDYLSQFPEITDDVWRQGMKLQWHTVMGWLGRVRREGVDQQGRRVVLIQNVVLDEAGDVMDGVRSADAHTKEVDGALRGARVRYVDDGIYLQQPMYA